MDHYGGYPTTNKRWGAVFVGGPQNAKHTNFAGPGWGIGNFLTGRGDMLWVKNFYKFGKMHILSI